MIGDGLTGGYNIMLVHLVHNTRGREGFAEGVCQTGLPLGYLRGHYEGAHLIVVPLVLEADDDSHPYHHLFAEAYPLRGPPKVWQGVEPWKSPRVERPRTCPD